MLVIRYAVESNVTARVSDRLITVAQVKSIHVALHRLGLEDAEYRELLKDWNVSTCKDLTRRQASDLLARLGRPLPNPPGAKPKTPRRRRIANPADAPPPEDGDGIIRLATPDQRGLIDELAGEIAWETDDGYVRWLRRSLGLERVRTRADANRTIQGLRGLKAHGHAKSDLSRECAGSIPLALGTRQPPGRQGTRSGSDRRAMCADARS